METSNQTSEFHVAQQSRREKLRVSNGSTSAQHLDFYPGNLEHLSLHQGLNVDIVQSPSYRYRNISYDPSLISSEMINFSTSTQNCSTWKNIGTQQIGCDWNVANYSSGIESNLTSPMFVGESLKLNDLPGSTIEVKPNYYGYHKVQSQSSVTNPSSDASGMYSTERQYGDMQFNSTNSLYHNTLQEVVTSATIGTQSDSMASRAIQNGKALALSLSPVPQSKTFMGQSEERNTIGEDLYSQCHNVPAESTCPREYTGNKVSGNASLAIPHRDAVPLGPFTGYATILNSSKFLRPAQHLLDEFCNLAGSKATQSCDLRDNDHEGVRVSRNSVNVIGPSEGAILGGSGSSSSLFYSSNIQRQECGGMSSSGSTVLPEYLQQKAKLMYMQDEVCRRYKQYHQQMQMVVSSFETVVGLSAATPYISLALKMVSRHFKSLRNAISNQLRSIRHALGEDAPSPTTGTSKGEGTSSRLKFADQNQQKQKTGGAMAFFESQQHVWRPQRGLPERAVAILRAWLFDHFLHPYPTDGDKHMLATQTGLTRNQVSNWFINARVRVWKPMVEEIHMLETKGLGETGSSVRRPDGKLVTEQSNRASDSLSRSSISISNHVQYSNRFNMSGISEKQDDYPGNGSSEPLDEDMWKNQEKRSRLECHIPANMSDSLMGFVPYQRSGLEIGGGLGAVSLTLGLRQSAEGSQQQQQHQFQQQDRLRQQFGGQMIHDFVG